MSTHDEHDDDLEPEVSETAGIETEKYEEADEEDIVPETEATISSDRDEEGRVPSDAEEEEPEGEASDTI